MTWQGTGNWGIFEEDMENHGIPIETKIRWEEVLEWPIAMYRRESWTNKNEKTTLKAF
jgi:hypothetical protein